MKLFLMLVALSFLANGQNTKSVTGTATYRERLALPPNAVFEATFQDVSRADAPAIVIGTARLDKPGQPPFRFSIPYDPAKIVKRNSYVVRAQITVDGKLMFTTTQSYSVLTRGKGASVEMLLQRVSSPPEPSKPDSSLRETYWKLLEVDGKTVVLAEQQREPNLILHTAESSATGYGGCNGFRGTYTLDGAKLTFDNLASTLMACAQGMNIEAVYPKILANVGTWKISGEQLELYGADSKLLARFQAVALR